MNNKRLDILMFEKDMCKSRERAQQLIKNGNVSVNGKKILKPSFSVSEKDRIDIDGDIHKYVGRGGLKLEKAINEFKISLYGTVCLDIGASTGGFTDCMLQNGAQLVYALDVGHSQLDDSLISDSRVVNMEKTNIRDSVVSDFSEKISFIATDVSFISLKLVLPKIKELLAIDGSAVVLIKPQFEAGKSKINKNGIVKDSSIHRQILSDITSFAENIGFCVFGLCISPIKGGSGNSEYLMCLKHIDDCHIHKKYDFNLLVEEALNKEHV